MKLLKHILFDECKKLVRQRIEAARKGIEELQEAANEETKSSAGDKYETGRAMMQLEKDKYAAQLVETMKLEKVLSLVNPDKEETTAGLGSLVATNQGTYFLTIPLGRINIDGKDYYLLSPASPIGTLLKHKKKGDTFDFNGRKYEVKGVW